MIKRLRIFAGPNGSGKSTFIQEFPETDSLKLGIYVNADDIEKSLKTNQRLDLKQFQIQATTQEVQDYFKASTFAPEKLQDPNLYQKFRVDKSYLYIKEDVPMNSYIAADLAGFLRRRLADEGTSFAYETVMSDHNKIEFLEFAKRSGYRIYLYYFTTEDPQININRVQIRVAQGGHTVDDSTIKNRYYKSLDNLLSAIDVSNRAYLFDNTNKSILIAEITDGKEVQLRAPNLIPNWFVKYVVEKK